MKKQETRKQIKIKLAELGDVYRNGASMEITKTLRDMTEYKNAKTVMLYVAVGKEVITQNMMTMAQRDGKRICLPLCTDTDNHIMEAKLWDANYRLEQGAYGIPTPSAKAPTIDAEEIDLVVIPCVTCDRDCNRLGHGAGYYDRYLETLREDCSKIAICYETIIRDTVPTEAHDRKMDAVITEEKIYRRK